MKFVTFKNNLIANLKAQYILHNVVNVGKNTLAVLNPICVRRLIIIKVLTVNLRTKDKLLKKL